MFEYTNARIVDWNMLRTRITSDWRTLRLFHYISRLLKCVLPRWLLEGEILKACFISIAEDRNHVLYPNCDLGCLVPAFWHHGGSFWYHVGNPGRQWEQQDGHLGSGIVLTICNHFGTPFWKLFEHRALQARFKPTFYTNCCVEIGMPGAFEARFPKRMYHENSIFTDIECRCY